eukprot:gene10180-13696_t
MALHFVSTSILSSENGIDFSKEEAVESVEAKRMHLDAIQASNKPLYQQLAEQKEKKQAEFDEVKKLIFAPPKALDDEEIHFLNDVEETKNKALEKREEREQEELKKFRDAQLSEYRLDDNDNNKSSSLAKGKFVIRTEKKEKNPTIIPQIKAKRKTAPGSEAKHIEGNKIIRKEDIKEKNNNSKSENELKSNDNKSSLSGMFASYNSDDET